MFITFEGIDGAGKSSHIQAVADRIREAGFEVVLTREPGGTPLGEKLRALGLNDAMDPLTEALVMFASRREHIKQIIEPALARGAVVISDRFTDSTFAYQGGGRGFDQATLRMLESMVQRTDDGLLLQPDVTFLFKLDPAIAAQRLAGAREPDKFEAMQREFFQAVSDGYMERLNAQPGRFVLIDAAQSIEEVRAQVNEAMGERVLMQLDALRHPRQRA